MKLITRAATSGSVMLAAALLAACGGGDVSPPAENERTTFTYINATKAPTTTAPAAAATTTAAAAATTTAAAVVVAAEAEARGVGTCELSYEEMRKQPPEVVRRVQEAVGADPDGIWGPVSEGLRTAECWPNEVDVATTTTTAAAADAATTTAATTIPAATDAATTTAATTIPTTTTATTTTIAAATAGGAVLDWPRVAPEIDAPPYNRPDWTRAVNRALRWRQADCKWAFYASSPQPACNDDPNRDHLVAVAEALDSGLELFHLKTFYLDADNLYVMPGDENRRKSDGDPADWLPPKEVCRYITEWVAVKNKYELTVDIRELAAMESAVSGCGDTTAATTATTTAATTTATTTAATTATTAAVSGEEEWGRFKKLNCDKWPDQGKTTAELRAMVQEANEAGFDWGRKDGNDDGYPCEAQLGKKGSY